MKNNKFVWKVIAFVLLIPAFILPFINVFEYTVATGGNQTGALQFHLFGNYADAANSVKLLGKNLQTGWMIANAVFVTILMVLAVALLVLIILELCKFSFKGQKLVHQIVAYSILACGILAFGLGAIGVIVNSFSVTIARVVTEFGIHSQFGLFLELCFIAAGVFAVLGLEKNKKAKKTK